MTKNLSRKTIEELEGSYWDDPVTEATGLMKTCHALRKVPLSELQMSDIRFLIAQNIGLDYLIPIALGILEKNLFVEAMYYEGDLLKAVLNVTNDFWLNHTKYLDTLVNTFKSGFHKKSEIEFYDETLIYSLVELYNAIVNLQKSLSKN